MFADSQGFGSSLRRVDSILLQCNGSMASVCLAMLSQKRGIYRNGKVQLKQTVIRIHGDVAHDASSQVFDAPLGNLDLSRARLFGMR